MTDAEAPYPKKPVLMASARRVPPSVTPAVCFAAVALIALVTSGFGGALAAAVGAMVFALAARRELRSDDDHAGARRSLAAMIVGVGVAAIVVLPGALPLVLGLAGMVASGR